MEHTQQEKNNYGKTQRILMILVAVLVVVLVAAIIFALSLNLGGDDPKPSTTPSQTQPSVPPTTQTVAIKDLVMAAPENLEFITMTQQVQFAGSADPRKPVTIGGEEVTVNPDGTFIHTLTLENGMNEIPLTYMDETVTYRIEYRYAVETFFPEEATEYGCGATVRLTVSARKGSQVSAVFNGKTVKMKEAADQMGSGVMEGFVLYVGTYSMPKNNTEDLNLGVIEYTVVCDGITETYKSGEISCRKSGEILKSDPSVTPSYGDYVDVGSGYILEILTNSAETFDGKTVDDKSSPTRNYLPKGTLDYCSQKALSTGGSQTTMLMRCGRRVYVKKSNYPSGSQVQVIDCYQGTLPDHNEVGIYGVDTSDAFTILTFDVLWKAPFYFDLAPQEYIRPSIQDYRVNKLTAEYVDITFCYATVFEGNIQFPSDHPLFSSAELTQRESDCTLRLYLKKTGGFYGWDAYYNEDDQLCFRFLNPPKVSATTDNVYGANLTGVRIMLDVGHGGKDGGAAVRDENGKEVDEASLNLRLALIVKAELEKMGATVIMNRTDDSAITIEERIAFLKEQGPDLCIAIHQNSIGGYPNISGLLVGYSTPFSQLAAKYIYQETQNSGIYSKSVFDWHYYYVARETACPVVLMENGYMTNAQDFANMRNDEVLLRKAEAMARGVAKYFLDIGR